MLVVSVINKSVTSENLWNFLWWKDNSRVSCSYIWTENVNRETRRAKNHSWWWNVIVKTRPLRLTFFFRNWKLERHALSASDSGEVNRSNGIDENNVEDNARARTEQKGRSNERAERQERGKDWNRRGANFSAVTGFMSFPPFGGFHFQSGLPELVIQTRPRNERCHRRRRRRRLPPLPADPPSARNSRLRTRSPLASDLPSRSPPSSASR